MSLIPATAGGAASAAAAPAITRSASRRPMRRSMNSPKVGLFMARAIIGLFRDAPMTTFGLIRFVTDAHAAPLRQPSARGAMHAVAAQQVPREGDAKSVV